MHRASKHSSRHELVLLDEKNARSIVRITPEAFGTRVRQLCASDDNYLLGLSEARLRGELLRRGKKPCATDNRIRLQFWLEYQRVRDEDIRLPEMNMAYVIGFAISKEAFYSHYINDNAKLAWLLCPPVEYTHAIEEILRDCMVHIQTALEKAVTGPPGQSFSNFKFLLQTDMQIFKRWQTIRDPKNLLLGLHDNDEKPKITKADHGVVSAPLTREERLKRLEDLRKQAGVNLP